MSVLLQAERLSLSGRLSETSLQVQAGELVCLVGPNGSGKTSLLHALAGIGDATGSVRIGGVDPNTIGSDQRRRLLSFLPAGREAHWPLTATDLVALGLPGRDRKAIPPLLAEFGLADFAERHVDRMSTGERSRVLIARALVAEPTLLLLDEPVANLDPLWQLRFMEGLRDIAHSDGRSVLAAIHDLDLAVRYADRLIIMDRGRIAADGDPATLVKDKVIADIFGIERGVDGWRPVRPADRRSLP